MENTINENKTVAIPKELYERIEKRHEKRNQILDFIKLAQEKRDECKDKNKLSTINLKIDMANFKLICELDELLADVEYGTVE